ncbi:transporter [Sulfurovum sp.]|uniref:transporter n=1 Tax=Sulfurovum sp. TaxID=1969726 RepID=UPI002868256F|nr:transporter [Sulfurovum sp.]
MKKSILILLLFIEVQVLNAQTLEPKLYANTPIDVNVMFLGYGHTQGAIPENQSLGLEDPNLKIDSTILLYARSFGYLGHNAKFDIIFPYSTLSGTAQHFGMDVSRSVHGMGDTKARLTFNLLGAPALALEEFSSYQQDTIIGLSIQATIPTGQYDKSKLVNIGTNRWAIKPAIGFSKKISNFEFEFGAEAEFYTTNEDFYGDITRKQDPVYSTQGHVLYTFKRAMWLAIGVTYYWGGEYINDGIGSNEELRNSRMGLTFAMPIDKQNSIKIYGNTGINVRYGTDFDAIAIAWQYSWTD